MWGELVKENVPKYLLAAVSQEGAHPTSNAHETLRRKGL